MKEAVKNVEKFVSSISVEGMNGRMRERRKVCVSDIQRKLTVKWTKYIQRWMVGVYVAYVRGQMYLLHLRLVEDMSGC